MYPFSIGRIYHLKEFCFGFEQAISTHFHPDKMAAISQTTFPNAFSWMKVLYFDSNFTAMCSYGSIWIYFSIGSDNGLAPIRRQAIIWTNTDPVDWRTIVALEGGGGGVIKPLVIIMRGEWLQLCWSCDTEITTQLWTGVNVSVQLYKVVQWLIVYMLYIEQRRISGWLISPTGFRHLSEKKSWLFDHSYNPWNKNVNSCK